METIKKVFAKDAFARRNGIALVHVSEGEAVASMQIEPHHLNSFGVTHGGALFTLADFAFAVAGNTHGNVALSINSHMSYIKATSQGVLTAYAHEVKSSRKLGMYRVEIKDEADEIIATFEGMVYKKKETLESLL
jgi:acyl-CoA thioesterase